MSTLSPPQIYALARQAGLNPVAAATATAVALAESGGRTDAVGDVALEDATWGPSVGLWQIRSLKAQSGTGQARDATRLTDPTFNAQSMASISGKGSSFSAWSTYKSGAYRQFLSAAQAGGVADGDTQQAVTGYADAHGEVDNAPTQGGIDWGSVGKVAAGAALGVPGALAAGLTSNWGADALKIGLYVIGGAAAAGMVIVGASHTVSTS